MMVHAAIPFVDGKKSHEQDGFGSVNEQLLILQFLLAGNRLEKHVSCLMPGVDMHRVNKPIFVWFIP